MSAVVEKLLTVEEFEKIPDPPGAVLELRHGEAVPVTFPVKRHKELQRRLRSLFEDAAGGLGVVDSEFPYRPLPEHELWCADVAFVTQDRYDSSGKWLDGSPELVIEIKSPSNTKAELHDKAMTALAGGALQFWVVDSDRKTVTVYSQSSGIQVYEGDCLAVPILGIELSLERIFGVG